MPDRKDEPRWPDLDALVDLESELRTDVFGGPDAESKESRAVLDATRVLEWARPWLEAHAAVLEEKAKRIAHNPEMAVMMLNHAAEIRRVLGRE